MQPFLCTTEFWNRWLASQSRGENAEAWRGVMCVLRWLAIREENRIPPPGRFTNLEEDITFSALLRRLIQGKEPLPEPPPESFGQPWYDLMEHGRAEAVEVNEVSWGKDSHIIINQAIWRIDQIQMGGQLIVSHREDGPRFRLKQEGGTWCLTKM